MAVLRRKERCLRTILILGLALAGAALPGCSGLVYRAAYNHADRLILRELDKYFELDSTQEEFWKGRLAKILARHRNEELPRYRQFLVKIRSHLARGLAADRLNATFHNDLRLIGGLYRLFIPDFSEFLTTVRPRQLEHLRVAMRESNKEWSESLRQSAAKRREKRTAELEDFFEDWIGKLNDGQKQIVARWTAEMPDTTASYLAYRKLRQQQFARLIGLRPGREAIARQLSVWLIDRQQNLPERYRTESTLQSEIFRKLMIGLDRTLSAEQRQQAMERLDGFIALIDELLRK